MTENIIISIMEILLEKYEEKDILQKVKDLTVSHPTTAHKLQDLTILYFWPYHSELSLSNLKMYTLVEISTAYL